MIWCGDFWKVFYFTKGKMRRTSGKES